MNRIPRDLSRLRPTPGSGRFGAFLVGGGLLLVGINASLFNGTLFSLCQILYLYSIYYLILLSITLFITYLYS